MFSHMRSYLAIGLLLCLAISHVSANCSGNCPDTEDVVWAVGAGCSVFRNKCYFDKENCHRKPPLEISTKEECQKFCASACPQVFQPTSGNYKGQTRTFSNECEKRAHTCQTGETFL